MTKVQDISFISIENQKCDFPKHFHETFCISLIKRGIEKIELENEFLYSNENCISITNPYEIHANPIVDKDIEVCFDTIYISTELMSYILKKREIEFSSRQIQNSQINKSFVQVFEYLKSENIKTTETSLKKFIYQIFPYSQIVKENSQSPLQSEYLSELITFIEHNLDNKIYLNELAKIAHLNKFSFSKKFKSLTGMTPMSYVLMKKVFSAKNQFTTDCDITDIAYSYNFADVAHFSHAFKKYVGISPKEYRTQLKK
ncbi:AraC family transcriptional regulator [Flavobacterium sp. Sd200]|uniref:AraC family transcriptional regulator n=1 Tax=Flavobacterium sp. Sd200 TaxID=2692211 RepID=UPI0013695D19|nr:AraC family transcriptional regulator [Flavobacterium sp. Sd200]MXN93248.1 AraC family transcriptional regulator [Flavobacterium sp. Sd200]